MRQLGRGPSNTEVLGNRTANRAHPAHQNKERALRRQFQALGRSRRHHPKDSVI